MHTTTDHASSLSPELGASVTFDLYRDIHKGIRAELFAVTSAAGNIDPNDHFGRVALSEHLTTVVELLRSHAEHEDVHIEPMLHVHAPDLAARVATDHATLEARIARIDEIARAARDDAASGHRALVHHVYLELSAFTSSYLEHQLVEEREIMPALERAVGVDEVLAIHGAIISSIPPEEMARTLALMLPAMNLDDRTELMEGMRMTAPPPVFDGVVSIARSVLEPADYVALGDRLRLG